ncbi:MAG: hypothetical protein Q7J08_00195 [Methanocorpusculum sp.]|uniref:hypothetical protein n=1 Tax=Methanocorpusculum sp. TaxID=2058474 RepID=UPI00271A1B0C|nr:hypothetical protein [Methanocorpusculum sp.]MDO9522126.1 hypothetical protein [Methanocorpusculum sp.]
MDHKLSGAESYLNQKNQTITPQYLTKGSHQWQYPDAQRGILAQIDYRDPCIRTLFSPLILGCIKEILEKGQGKT